MRPPPLPLLQRTLPGLVAGVLLISIPATAGAAATPAALPLAAFRVGGAWLGKLSPSWWETPRNRAQVELGAEWRPSKKITLGASFDALRADFYADGSRHGGPGDLSLRTDLRLWQGPLEGRLCWSVKLPDADDELELGSDETDVRVGLRTVTEAGPARISGQIDLAVLGDPHQATAQAWLPEFSLDATLGLGLVVPHAAISARPGDARLAPRSTLSLGLEGRCPVLAGAETVVGLAQTGPAFGGRVWVGWGAGCDANQ